MAGASLALVVCRIDVDKTLEKIEWSTLFFFIGLFVLVSGAEQAGLMDKLGHLLTFTEGWPLLLTVLTVMWVSGIAAAVMNNVSFTAAMVTIVAAFLNSSPTFATPEARHLMWWGLALAVCLGGNGTIVGAAANLITAGISEKAGHKVTFREFFAYGFPVTFFSLLAASLYIALRYFVTLR